jgi:hypothetical protein
LRKIRVIIALVFVAAVMAALTTQSLAFPPFVGKAAKFGARDCKFCHTKADGGTPFNARGNWLIKERTRRKADAVDPEWLVDYKPAKKSKK